MENIFKYISSLFNSDKVNVALMNDEQLQAASLFEAESGNWPNVYSDEYARRTTFQFKV